MVSYYTSIGNGSGADPTPFQPYKTPVPSPLRESGSKAPPARRRPLPSNHCFISPPISPRLFHFPSMEGNLKISIDKLPIKRLDAIEENGFERYPHEIGQDEKRLALIRRIDFTPLVEKDSKKVKTSKEATATTPWPWQSVVENLQLAQQELSVIIDLINTVEANDAVTVAGMTRPKLLPNEVLSDLAVSAATKLQSFRHLGRYFKQSTKALERQVAREARFYGALIRLQQNWKVKRQRLAAGPNSEGFMIDLYDHSLLDPMAVFRPYSTVRVDHDSAGMLSIHLPPKSRRSLNFGFTGGRSSIKSRKFRKSLICGSDENPLQEVKKDAISDEDVDKCVEKTHLALREIHQAIFEEQVFDLVNREAFYPSKGVNVIGIQEDYLQLGISKEASVFLSLAPYNQDTDQTSDTVDHAQNGERGILPLKVDNGVTAVEKQDTFSGLPSPLSCEIYLRQILHENVFVRVKDRRSGSEKSGQNMGDGYGLLDHFCMTLAHRIFARKVLAELENLVSRVPYLHLSSHPTWHSRTSSWSLSVKVPQSILHGRNRKWPLETDYDEKNMIMRSQFSTKVVVNDECISVSGEGAPNVVGLFRGGGAAVDVCSMNCYNCDLEDLSVILLQQVASQVVRWLHEEALIVGMKASRDFLGLSFELDQGDTLSLVGHVDPDDAQGCISWWLVLEDGLMDEAKFGSSISNGGSGNKRFLGYLSLEALYSTLMDLVTLCSGSGGH